jgi:hypothetical protein
MVVPSLDLVDDELDPFQLVLRQLPHPLPQLLDLLLRRRPRAALLQLRLHSRGNIGQVRSPLV